MPPGVIVQYVGATAPSGFLLCQGQAVSRTTYAALFAALGGEATPYGVGDGTTTFNLPNLQGRVPVGKSSETEFDTLGETGGAKTHTLTTAEMPSHTHQISVGSGGDWNDFFAGSTSAYGINPTYSGSAYSSPLSSVGGGGAHNNLQPYIVVNYIVKH
jgi:microcystin-dependent protein